MNEAIKKLEAALKQLEEALRKFKARFFNSPEKSEAKYKVVLNDKFKTKKGEEK